MNILQKLVSISSISGHESKLILFIEKYLKRMGFSPLLLNGNLVLHIKGIQNKNALIFNCHVDTVSPGDKNLWKYDPYSGYIEDGKLYGLGASDEKAAIASNMLLAGEFSNKKPPCDLWFTFVVNEEIDGSGTKNFLEWFSKTQKYKNVAAILGEPTDLTEIQIAHKGNVFIKITTKGDSGHGSEPKKIKKHAIKNLISITQKIENMAKNWEDKYYDDLLGNPTIALTSINGGDLSTPNKFPDSCSATFDIRTTPTIHNKVIDLLKNELSREDCQISLIYEPAPYGYTNENDHIVKIAQDVTKAKVSVSNSSNDLCFFTQKNIPGIVYGPGSHAVIHKPNEYCKVDNIKACLNKYSEFIYKFSCI